MKTTAFLPIFTLLLLAAFSTGCISGLKTTDYGKHTCAEGERNLKNCTGEFKPVCGTLIEGATVDSSTHLTYLNKCFACSDAQVETWVSGACMEEVQGTAKCSQGNECYKGMNVCTSAGNCTFHAISKI